MDCYEELDEVDDVSSDCEVQDTKGDLLNELSLDELREAKSCLEDYKHSEIVNTAIDDSLNGLSKEQLYELKAEIEDSSDEQKILTMRR